ncbi:hypothetical protein EDC01DRAFT_14941 [Geopyxis carbonaria]|nr:hypothetical protein EDC01DRAFT_14941 [Geopyxis carbonaria]
MAHLSTITRYDGGCMPRDPSSTNMRCNQELWSLGRIMHRRCSLDGDKTGIGETVEYCTSELRRVYASEARHARNVISMESQRHRGTEVRCDVGSCPRLYMKSSINSRTRQATAAATHRQTAPQRHTCKLFPKREHRRQDTSEIPEQAQSTSFSAPRSSQDPTYTVCTLQYCTSNCLPTCLPSYPTFAIHTRRRQAAPLLGPEAKPTGGR